MTWPTDPQELFWCKTCRIARPRTSCAVRYGILECPHCIKSGYVDQLMAFVKVGVETEHPSAALVKALCELICEAAPLSWAAGQDMESAAAWEKSALMALRAAGYAEQS